MALAGNALNLTNAFLSHRSIDNPVYIIAAVVSVLMIGQVAGLAILKGRGGTRPVSPLLVKG